MVRQSVPGCDGYCSFTGKAGLFITFTTNPQWPEITASLFPGKQPSDRSDICARVFHLKLKDLINDLKSGILGRIQGYFGMKEDQKGGLPHCHILAILADEDKPREPDDIDQIVCAEIPDPQTNPILYDIITRNNIHGPCGELNQASPCMVGQGDHRHCEKRLPKAVCGPYYSVRIYLPHVSTAIPLWRRSDAY